MPLLIFAGTFALIITFLLGITPLWWVILPAALLLAWMLLAFLFAAFVVILMAFVGGKL